MASLSVISVKQEIRHQIWLHIHPGISIASHNRQKNRATQRKMSVTCHPSQWKFSCLEVPICKHHIQDTSSFIKRFQSQRPSSCNSYTDRWALFTFLQQNEIIQECQKFSQICCRKFSPSQNIWILSNGIFHNCRVPFSNFRTLEWSIGWFCTTINTVVRFLNGILLAGYFANLLFSFLGSNSEE